VRTVGELPLARAQTRKWTKHGRHDSRSLTSTRNLGKGSVGDVAGRENIFAWGEDIDPVTKVGERGEGVIDGGCTDGDSLTDTTRGTVVRVLAQISSGSDDRDALFDGVGNLWNAS